MIKYILVGIILTIAYRYWNPAPKIDKTGQEPDEYTDFEEIEE